jgi:hypothetical protein
MRRSSNESPTQNSQYPGLQKIPGGVILMIPLQEI